MTELPSQKVEMIPIDRITIVNPRVRNKRSFRDIIDNIAQLGLKKPITVSRRVEAGGPFYDLVCGQGRLEAFNTRPIRRSRPRGAVRPGRLPDRQPGRKLRPAPASGNRPPAGHTWNAGARILVG